jgi:phosphate transport system substrate-binding protein
MMEINMLKRFLLAAVTFTATFGYGQDVSSLPEYQPGQKVSGTLRSWGNDHMATLMKYWEEGFSKFQPEMRFEDTLKGTGTAQFALDEWVADLGLMGREIWAIEYYGVYRRSHQYPVGIEVATGSYDVRGKSFALSILVHKDNPISKLTLKQLDGIFGAERDGGWQGLNWHREVARTAKDNIRTWGQLGLTGAWADKQIHPYGPPGIYPGAVTFFQEKVLGGGDKWSEDLLEYRDPEQMVTALGKDPYGIAYTGICYKTQQVKAVALGVADGGPYIEPTRENVANRTYPLTRPVFIYFTTDTPTGDLANPKIAPKVKEFLQYVLSNQGQKDVIQEGDYLPLTAPIVREQLRKLE